ncbi:MAG: glutaminase A [Ramlibacter sp.]|jgi:glutaminase|nr:glutaminase A [Ramlibacter sp.]
MAADPHPSRDNPFPIETYLRTLYERHRGYRQGQVADYIPELAKAEPDWFGICIATRDGHVYEVGDTGQAFTIQSISKALTYGLALEDQGEAGVLARIGVEPSGEAFNAISLKPVTGVPFNPMINAGAIASCGQVARRGGKSRIQRITAYLSGCAGRELDIDPLVYQSESATGHRNRAIGWMLRNFDIIEEEPTEILEAYFQQCAIRVTCRDLAIMAATLANHGVNPVTRQPAIAPEYIANILSVMSTCGMYDFSGGWIYDVGLPAKSGVGGGIMAVLPGQLGIGVFSPPLDAQGNSARGIRVCADLSRELALHVFRGGAGPVKAQRLSYDNAQVRSRRRRPPKHRQLLGREGHRVRVIEMQGDLVFSTIEPVLRSVQQGSVHAQQFVLNLRNVISADDTSLRLIAELQRSLAPGGARLVVCHARALVNRLAAHGFDVACSYPDDDAALEACENVLLAELLGPPAQAREALTLAQCELLDGLSPDNLAWLEGALQERHYAARDTIVRSGDPGDALFLLLDGSVEVRLPAQAGKPGRRIDLFTAGMTFGEMAFIDGSPRSADVVALDPVHCRVLDRDTFNRLDTDNPGLKISLLQQITRHLSVNLRRINAEVLAFKG